MSLSDLGILALCALVGWAVVSWIISVVQQQKRPPLDLTGGSPPPQRDPLRGLPSPSAGRDPIAPTPSPRAGRDPVARAPTPAPVPGAVGGDNGVRDLKALSLAEVSARWSSILGVRDSASSQQIEAAYHAGLAECDRIRFSPSESATAKSAAEARRAQITQAFEFIRPLK